MPESYGVLEASSGREIMSKSKMLTSLFVVAFAASLGLVGNASAAKKVTYDQAWAICKAKMDKAGVYGTGLQANERYTRGAGCMKKYGYRI
jgi:hypothetical protein